MKRFLYYFVWTIGIGVLIYWGMKIKFHLEDTAAMEFKYYPVIIFAIVFPFIIGLLLRLPKLIIEIRENRPWAFDWQKFIAIALPALFIVLIFISTYTGMVTFVNFILIDGALFITIAGIVLGYSLLDCLKGSS